MAGPCVYKEFIQLMNLLNDICNIETFQLFKAQLINKRKREIKKTYKSLFNYNKLKLVFPKKQYNMFVNNSLESILEFINKSLDINEFKDNKLKILLHLNRLIAFNFDRVLDAGLRSFNQEVKDDFRSFNFNSYNLHIPWSIDLLNVDFCFIALIKHFIYITILQPFRAFNMQTAFAWGLVLERLCINNLYSFHVIKYIPILSWSIFYILQNKDISMIFKKEGPSIILNNFIEKLVFFKSNLAIPDNLYQLLNKRQLTGLLFIIKKKCVTRQEYAKHFRVSFMTAYRDLKYMVSKNILLVYGNNNKTTYCVNNSINFLS